MLNAAAMSAPPIDSLMEKGLCEAVFPGAVLLAGKAGGPLFFKAYGLANRFDRTPMTRQTVFDLASLTKPLATTLAVARLVDQGRLALDEPVAAVLPVLAGTDKDRITPRHLLCHQSGLPAHALFYMTLRDVPPASRKTAMLTALSQMPLVFPPGTDTLYSDLGFMLLCRLVENVSGLAMDRFLATELYGPMGCGDLFFVDLTAGGVSRTFPFAATELCPVRNRLLIGEVHDDNAGFAGGVDGQAGLFGTAEAVFRLLQGLAAEGEGTYFFSRSMREAMLYGNPGHRFTLGFDRPSPAGSSAGRHFSADTIGHLGFTGTSFWMDLKQSVSVILLTHRVHPFRWNTRLRDFRPVIHDAIMEYMGFSSDQGRPSPARINIEIKSGF